jgi:ribosomal protein L32E
MALRNLSSDKSVAPSELRLRFGWDQFFRGRIAKAWRKPIGTFYKIRQPGESFTPDQWMRAVIKELWAFSIAI